MKLFGGKKVKLQDCLCVAFYALYFICVVLFIVLVFRNNYKMTQLSEQTEEVTKLLEERVETLDDLIEQEEEANRLLEEAYSKINKQ